MRYKCRECGLEYEQKPDFCDCGNDEFECVGDTVPEQPKKVEVKPAKPASQTLPKEPKKETVKRDYSPLKTFFDPISTVIFLVCMILSIYVIFFAWNPKEQAVVEETVSKPEVTKNIPSIDKFWNNAVPVVTVPQKAEEPKKAVEQIIPKIIQTEKTQPKTNTKQTVTQTKKQTTQTTKTQSTPKTTTVKLTKNTNTSTVSQAQAKAKQEAEAKAKQEAELKAKQEAEAKARQEAELKAKQEAALKAKQAAEAKAKQAEAAKQELAVYKTNLRNTIGHKIDFTKVVGDGACTVAFKINSSGQLVSRSFTQQSTNITLNDAVYAAMMSTPKFNPPPSAYNNETLSLYVKFYNGNFEISLK